MNVPPIAAVALASSLALLAAGCDRTAEETAATDTQGQAGDMGAPSGEMAAPSSEMERPAGDRAGDIGDTMGRAASQAGQAIDDAAITTAVKSKYLADDILKGLEINVDTEQGAVTLTGAVQSEAAKERATQIAQTVDGVVNVNNQLTVEGAQ